MAAKKLYALSAIDHDGTRYAPGEALPAMTEAQAQALVAAGVVSSVKPQTDPGEAPAGEGQGA